MAGWGRPRWPDPPAANLAHPPEDHNPWGRTPGRGLHCHCRRHRHSAVAVAQDLVLRVAAAGMGGKLYLEAIPELVVLCESLDAILAAGVSDPAAVSRAWLGCMAA